MPPAKSRACLERKPPPHTQWADGLGDFSGEEGSTTRRERTGNRREELTIQGRISIKGITNGIVDDEFPEDDVGKEHFPTNAFGETTGHQQGSNGGEHHLK